MRARSSVMWTTLIGVTPAVSGSSVNGAQNCCRSNAPTSVPSPPEAFGTEESSRFAREARAALVCGEAVGDAFVDGFAAAAQGNGLSWTAVVLQQRLARSVCSELRVERQSVCSGLVGGRAKAMLPSLLPIRLKPCELNDPATSGEAPPVLLAMRLPLAKTVPLPLEIPPPRLWPAGPPVPPLPPRARLAESVLLATLSVPPL